MKKSRRSAVVAIALGISALLLTPGSHALPAAAGPQATTVGYATPVVVTNEGDELTFYNFDIDTHDIRSDDVRVYEILEDGTITGDWAPWCPVYSTPGRYTCLLFYSDEIGLASSSEVYGVSGLAPGSYTFYCGPHPWMTGTIVVTESQA